MKKYFDVLCGKVSNGFTHISDFIAQHTYCFALWVVSLFVAGAIFLNQEVDHTSSVLNQHKRYLILDMEHQLLFQDFQGAVKLLGKREDSLRDAGEYIQEMQGVLIQQDQAIKQLMEELRKVKEGKPSRVEASSNRGGAGKKG